MIARFTSENRLEMPKAVLALCRAAEYFDVSVEDGRIVLTPLQPDSSGPVFTKEQHDELRAIQAGLAARGITEEDVAEICREVRREGNRAG